MEYNFFDFIGNIGVLLILVMYLSLQTDKISSNSLIYSLLNALGALLILISLYFQFNLSAFIIEFFWLVISLYGLYKNLKNKKIN
ncbi:hypothetical protein CPG38_13610 [Malaciobacter marinus]|nr:hypothetical protein CPG38_13610 [Malaciobacter marinus]